MRYEYALHFETPSKKNSRVFNTRLRRSFPGKAYQRWHSCALTELSLQQKPEKPVSSPCILELSFIHGDMRRRDSDNGASSILDLLVDAGILADDSWHIVRKIFIVNGYCKGKPACIITIRGLGECDEQL